MDSFVNMMLIDTNGISRYYSYTSKWNLLCEISFKFSSSHYRNTFDMSMICHIILNFDIFHIYEVLLSLLLYLNI